MKKIKNIVVILISVFLLSGCMKMHSNMTINSDKSMKYEMEYLISDIFLQTEAGSGENDATPTEPTTDANQEAANPGDTLAGMEEQFKKLGFTTTRIESQNGYSGVKATKDYKNIDDVSDEKGADISANDLMTSEKEGVIFKVEKGVFKDTYYYTSSSAFNTDVAETPESGETNDLENQIDQNPIEGNTPVEVTEGPPDVLDSDPKPTEGSTDDMSGLGDLMNLGSDMEFTFSVTLPSKPISHNATDVSNDGKTLTWKYGANSSDKSINFSFSFVKTLPLLLVCGGSLLVIIACIVIFFIVKNKRANKETLIHKDYDTNTVTQEDINKTSEQEKLEQQIDSAVTNTENADLNQKLASIDVNNNTQN